MSAQVSKEAVALQLQESFWRKHQVLPGRTHPEMDMSGTGGYILTGIKTADNTDDGLAMNHARPLDVGISAPQTQTSLEC